jgi:hypothetical protein
LLASLTDAIGVTDFSAAEFPAASLHLAAFMGDKDGWERYQFRQMVSKNLG